MTSRARALLFVSAALAAGPARAVDSLSLRLEPSYTSSDQRSTDQTGKATQIYSSGFTSKVDLALREEILPLLQAYGSGTFQRAQFSNSTDGVVSDSLQDQWRLYGRLQAGDRRLNGAVDVTETQQSLDSRSAGVTASGPTLVQQVVGAAVTWRPDDLPSLSLRALRSDQYDRQRVLADSTTTSASAALQYEVRKLSAYYSLGYTNPVDHLKGVETTNVGQSVTLSASDSYYDERVRASLDYQGGQSIRWVTVHRPGATVVTRIFTVQGLSGIETFPSLPTHIALGPNSAVIDGDTVTPAGLDIGWGPSLGPDNVPRDVGVKLPDLVTAVNEVSLYVDRQLPTQVSAALAFTVYRSDDNLEWTPVALSGAVTFDVLQNRFVIAVSSTRARYLKAVVRPLAAGVTSDAQYRAINITELQVASVAEATAGGSRATSIQGSANAGLRVDILRGTTRLAYDFQGLLSHRSQPSGTVLGLVTNGLSLDRPLGADYSLSARGERTDGSTGAGHEGSSRYTLRLGAQPLPTLGGSATYAGQVMDNRSGTTVTNSFLFFGRAEPYRGVSLSSSFTLALGSLPGGVDTRSTLAQASVSLVPNPVLTLVLSYAYSDQRTTTDGSTTGIATERIEGAVTVAPFAALFASASASRTRSQGRWYTLLNLTGNFAPFPSGDLLLSATYSDTLDTSSDSRTRSAGPYARWNISRRGVFVESSFNWIETTSPATGSRSRAFLVRLVVPL